MTTIPICLEVEVEALLIALSKMPGDVRIILDLPRGSGTWQLTEKAKREIVGDAASMPPSPANTAAKDNKQDIKRGPAGRVARGVGRELLLKAVEAGTIARADLIKVITQSGMSDKGAQGVLKRATRDKLVKTNGRGIYAVTPKGRMVVAEPTQTPGNKQERPKAKKALPF
jgi:hypothetical protein